MEIESVAEQFRRLPRLKQIETATEAEKRHQIYFRMLRPWEPIPANLTSPAPSVFLATMVVGLESYYNLVHQILDIENFRISKALNRVPSQPKKGFDITPARNEFLPVMQNGDWRKLKEKWFRQKNPQPNRPQETGDLFTDGLAYAEYLISKQAIKYLPEDPGLTHALKVIALVPDQTNPFDVREVDPDPNLF